MSTKSVATSNNFCCNICGYDKFSPLQARTDGRLVVQCDRCKMGVLQRVPEDLSIFYEGDYYSVGESTGKEGYSDYEFTAEHSLLWVKLCVNFLFDSGVILDVGCADGHLLAGLSPKFSRYGVEASHSAAARAARKGVNIISDDLFAVTKDYNWIGTFDVITSIATFEHLRDFKGAVSLCLDLLKNDGILVLEVPLISDFVNNDTWFSSSLEHVYYPTVHGLEWLLSKELGAFFSGGEIHIRGFASNYIALVTRNEATALRISEAYRVLTQPNPSLLSDKECALNLAFNVGHAFDTTPDRILMLPKLLKDEFSVPFLTRLTHLWHADSVAAAQLDWTKKTLDVANDFGSRQSSEVMRLVSLSNDLEQRVAFLENKLKEAVRYQR